jgi:hypothetical protein
MYHLWIVKGGRRFLYRKPFMTKDHAERIALATSGRAGIQRCEISDIVTGKVIFTVESVKGYC